MYSQLRIGCIQFFWKMISISLLLFFFDIVSLCLNLTYTTITFTNCLFFVCFFTSDVQNASILSAVLTLIKELDRDSLEVVANACKDRLESLWSHLIHPRSSKVFIRTKTLERLAETKRYITWHKRSRWWGLPDWQTLGDLFVLMLFHDWVRGSPKTRENHTLKWARTVYWPDGYRDVRT